MCEIYLIVEFMYGNGRSVPENICRIRVVYAQRVLDPTYLDSKIFILCIPCAMYRDIQVSRKAGRRERPFAASALFAAACNNGGIV